MKREQPRTRARTNATSPNIAWLALRVGNTIHALSSPFSHPPRAICGLKLRDDYRTSRGPLRWCQDCSSKAGKP